MSILLYSDKPLSGNEVAKQIGITRYYVFEILKKLSERDYITVTPTRPKLYSFSTSILQDKISETELYYDNLIKSVQRNGPFVVLSELKDFNTNAERIYVALKGRNHTVQSISKVTGIPHYTVRQILKQFVQYNLVRTRRSNKSILYFLYPSEIASEKLVEYLTELKEKRIKTLYAAYNKIVSHVKNKERILDEEIKIIEVTGLENVIKRVRFIIQKSSKILSIRGKRLFDAILNSRNKKEVFYEFNLYLDEVTRFVRRNGELNIIFSNYYLNAEKFGKMFNVLAKYKDVIDARLFNGPTYDIDIIDGKTIIEYLGGTPFKAIIINHPQFVNAQVGMFNLLWEKSQNFYYAYERSSSDIFNNDYELLIESLPVLRGENGINVVNSFNNAIKIWFYLVKNAKQRIYHVRYYPENKEFNMTYFQDAYSLIYNKGRENIDIKIISNFPNYLIKKIDNDLRLQNLKVESVKTHIHYNLNKHIGFDIIDDFVLIIFHPDDYSKFEDYKLIIVRDDILLNFMIHDFLAMWRNSYDSKFLIFPYVNNLNMKKELMQVLDNDLLSKLKSSIPIQLGKIGLTGFIKLFLIAEKSISVIAPCKSDFASAFGIYSFDELATYISKTPEEIRIIVTDDELMPYIKSFTDNVKTNLKLHKFTSKIGPLTSYIIIDNKYVLQIWKSEIDLLYDYIIYKLPQFVNRAIQHFEYAWTNSEEVII